jgi:hypothetical protein
MLNRILAKHYGCECSLGSSSVAQFQVAGCCDTVLELKPPERQTISVRAVRFSVRTFHHRPVFWPHE